MMTHATFQTSFDPRIEPQKRQAAGVRPRSQSFVARALLGNLALLSGLVVMPLVIVVGYLVQGQA